MNVKPTYVQALSWRLKGALTLQNSYDLLLLAGLALLLPGLLLLPVPLLRVPIGMGLALLAPGYTLVSAIFPRQVDIDGIIRAALSFGLSAAVLALLAVVLNGLPWGITPWPIAISLSIWIMLCCSIALWRRQKLIPSGQAYTPPMVVLSGWRPDPSRLPRSFYVASVLVLVGIVILSMRLFAPDPAAHPTEFYILGHAGRAEDYPRAAVAGEELTAIMGIANQETVQRTYHLEIWVIHPWNPDQRALVAREGPITLSPGHQQEWPISWRMPWSGDDQQVDFLLFTDDKAAPYRQLQLWVNVAGPLPPR